MRHWLDIVGDIVSAAGEGLLSPVLVLGDPAGRAADLCDQAGLRVVRAVPPHSADSGRREHGDGDTVIHASPERLPFADGAFGLVIAHATVEFSHDDRRVIAEFRRVLRPGGRLVVRLPRRGALTALDSLNLYRYVSEITGRGPIPAESLPIGWRRHYRRDDIDGVFGPSGLRVDSTTSGGLALGEAVYAPALVATRGLLQRSELARPLRRVYDRHGDLDERLPGPASWVVTATRPGD
jgi:SAM-dependent methyltransferase